jgi:hypothetical protein
VILIIKAIAIVLIAFGSLIGSVYLFCSIFVFAHYEAVITYIVEQWNYYLSPAAQQELMFHIATWGATIIGICVGIVMLGVFIFKIAERDQAIEKQKHT